MWVFVNKLFFLYAERYMYDMLCFVILCLFNECNKCNECNAMQCNAMQCKMQCNAM